MKDNKSIGKKVYALIEKGNFLTIDKNKVFTIVSIKPYNEANDWCNHLVIRSEDGEEKEIREYEAIFIPRPELSGDEQIDRYLADNDCYVDYVYSNEEDYVIVSISWGDWKHSHMWCDNLMSYIGYTPYCDPIVTEENGSDCYSAEHYYQKLA